MEYRGKDNCVCLNVRRNVEYGETTILIQHSIKKFWTIFFFILLITYIVIIFTQRISILNHILTLDIFCSAL